MMYSLNGGTPQSSPDFSPLAAGSYNIIVTDANGCTYQESFIVPEGDPIILDIGPDLQLDLGETIELTPTLNFPWTWNMTDSLVWIGDSLSCMNCLNPILLALNNGIITATVFAGNCMDSDTLSLRVDVDADIYVPNVFSPNHDGINDQVTVWADERVRKIVYLEIFDRWGNQVFVATNILPNDPLLGWDGSFKGKPMNPAVFAYIAKVELINGQQIAKKGDITLLR